MHWMTGVWSWLGPIGIFIVVPLVAGVIMWWSHRRVPTLLLPSAASEPTEEPDEGALIRFIGEHSWGRAERRRYIPAEYEGPISCLKCGRGILAGQFFWETPLVDPKTRTPIGSAFQICLSCSPGDAESLQGRSSW